MKTRITFLGLILSLLIIACTTGKQEAAQRLNGLDFQNAPKHLFAEKNDSLLSVLINKAPARYCDALHGHFVDIVVKSKIDSLKKANVKTILFYRDWIGTNGFNGYGKLIWKDKEKYIQYQFNFENYNKRYGISSILKSESTTSDAIAFYVENRMDTVMSMPKEPEYYMSHASDHFVYTSIDDIETCFNISGLHFMADSVHVKIQLVNKLKIPSNQYFEMLDDIQKLKLGL